MIAGLAFRPAAVGPARRKLAPKRCSRASASPARPRLHAEQLTYIDQKRLELARALALAPDLLLLDEWLAGLNPSELQEGIALIRSLRHDGLTIVMVEHVMDAIRSLCDRCIVMNAGRKIAEGPAAACSPTRTVIRAYLGEAMLEVEALSVAVRQAPGLDGVALKIGRGEIVTILGANGAGKTTLLKAIAGLLRPRRARTIALTAAIC